MKEVSLPEGYREKNIFERLHSFGHRHPLVPPLILAPMLYVGAFVPYLVISGPAGFVVGCGCMLILSLVWIGLLF